MKITLRRKGFEENYRNLSIVVVVIAVLFLAACAYKYTRFESAEHTQVVEPIEVDRFEGKVLGYLQLEGYIGIVSVIELIDKAEHRQCLILSDGDAIAMDCWEIENGQD